MTGASRRAIQKGLFEEFYDGTEYIGSSFTIYTIVNILKKTIPNVSRADVYQVIRSWQRSYDLLYDGIYNENEKLLECGITDTRKICKRKYKDGLEVLIAKKKVPLYYDRDIKEWRVAKTLEIYEEIMGDKVLHYHKLRNENLTRLAKRGGKLLSGTDTRSIIFDLHRESKKLEQQKELTEIDKSIQKKDNEVEHHA